MRLLITRVMPQTSRFGGITAQRIASSGFRALLRQREFRALWLADVQSLVGDFYFDETVNRSVSVDSRGMLEALRKVYHADAAANELVRR